jgi:serine/threonine-protein kinase
MSRASSYPQPDPVTLPETRIASEVDAGFSPDVRAGNDDGEALVHALAPTWVGGPAPLQQDPDEALVGTELGSFRIVQLLARGGMGSVYLARHHAIGSRVAVKFMHPQLAADPRLVARFYAEARAVNLIAHENVISIFDVGQLPPSRHYLIMEYLDGRSLADLQGPVPPRTLIPILAQICDALAAAHRHEIVHRDLKPDNIHLVQRGDVEHFVKLLDFGVARLGPATRGAATSAGQILGTPEYMAPEQSLSAGVDGRSDLYALGVIAFRLATGRVPFTGSPNEVLAAHRERRPPSPRELNPELPEALAQVILKALAKKPQDRFATAEEFKAALLQAVGERRTPVPQLPSDVSFDAEFKDATGQSFGLLRCTQLSRGGLFACGPESLPPLFSRLTATLRLEGTEWQQVVEVVRHVRPAEGHAWGMPAGFGVQFVNASHALKEAISRVLLGIAPRPATPVPQNEDPVASKVIAELLARDWMDPYAVLDIAKDGSNTDIRMRARAEQRRLEELKSRPLSESQRKRVSRCAERIEWANAILGQPSRRAQHDARIGNFRGVARCLMAGLGATELEALRARFIAEHPGAEARATVLGLTATSFEAQGKLDRALEVYERALALDPLRLDLHHGYSRLQRARPQASSADAESSDFPSRPAGRQGPQDLADGSRRSAKEFGEP